MADETPKRSRVSDELDVPSTPPGPADDDHILPLDDLRYPTLSMPEGEVSPSTGTRLSGRFDRDGLQALLRDLEAALVSHDLCLEGPDRRVTLGLGPGDVAVAFDPDEDHVGTLSIRIDLRAKALAYQEGDDPVVGARGGRGFIPKGLVTGEIEPGSARCYNWIEDPTEHLDEE